MDSDEATIKKTIEEEMEKMKIKIEEMNEEDKLKKKNENEEEMQKEKKDKLYYRGPIWEENSCSLDTGLIFIYLFIFS